MTNCTSLFETPNPKDAIRRMTSDIIQIASTEDDGCILVMDNIDAILPCKINHEDGRSVIEE